MISRYASNAEIRKVSEMPQGVVPHHKIDETKVMYFVLKRANFASSDGQEGNYRVLALTPGHYIPLEYDPSHPSIEKTYESGEELTYDESNVYINGVKVHLQNYSLVD